VQLSEGSWKNYAAIGAGGDRRPTCSPVTKISAAATYRFRPRQYGTLAVIDATTLEANAALRWIVRRDNGKSFEEFLTGLANKSGIETPTREDLARVDRKRKKKGSNREWVNPYDRDARITKMTDGRTHLAHKAEHAVDMETGAVVAVTLQKAHLGDTRTVKETLAEAGETVARLIEREAETVPAEAPKVNLGSVEELVADKGYHSGLVLEESKAAGVRTLHSREEADGPAALGG
jgi:transposase